MDGPVDSLEIAVICNCTASKIETHRNGVSGRLPGRLRCYPAGPTLRAHTRAARAHVLTSRGEARDAVFVRHASSTDRRSGTRPSTS